MSPLESGRGKGLSSTKGGRGRGKGKGGRGRGPRKGAAERPDNTLLHRCVSREL